MKPEKATEAPRNAGIDCVSDQKAPTETERASYQVREPMEDDDERFATRRGDMLPPVPELPIRKFEKTEQYKTNKTRKRRTVPPRTPTQKHGLTIAEVFSTICE